MELSLLTPFVAAIVAAVVAITSTLIAIRRLPSERRAAEVEAIASLASTYSELVCNLRDELTRIELKITDLGKRDRALIVDIERLRNDLQAANQRIQRLEAERQQLLDRIGKLVNRIGKLEIERQQLMEMNHDLVVNLSAEQDKRRELEVKLDELIKKEGGRRSEPP